MTDKNSIFKVGAASESVATAHDDFYGSDSVGATATADDASSFTRAFYDMATDLYQFGWSDSFHFAPLLEIESFESSLKRQEHLLASKLGLGSGMRCLDVGCGIMGPGREIARFSGAHVTGVTINEYQVKTARKKIEKEFLSDLCEVLPMNFHDLSKNFDAGHFDGAYDSEATCHSPDKVRVFSEIHHCLKPGGKFVSQAWVMTPLYDPDNAEHRRIKKAIEVGNALVDLPTAASVMEDLRAAGFDVLEDYDLGLDRPGRLSWWKSLDPPITTVHGFRRSGPGRAITNAMLYVLESIRLAPSGTLHCATTLSKGADALVEGGRLGIFTPIHMIVAQKSE